MDAENPDRVEEGKRQLAEVAIRYAGQHGLESRTVRWEERGFDLLLVFEDEQHQVEIPFSLDEVAYYPDDEDSRVTRRKIRDKFAGLSI